MVGLWCVQSCECGIPTVPSSPPHLHALNHACREVYDKLSPGFRGRCTAPLLIDKKTMRAVSNESSSIVRNLGQLQLPGCYGVDLYPQQLQSQIDPLNEQVG